MKRIILVALVLGIVSFAWPQEVITEFNNETVSVLNNELKKTTDKLSGAVSIGQLKGLIIENRTSDPDNPKIGQIWYRTDL
jgi:uncharacterized protein HemX